MFQALVLSCPLTVSADLILVDFLCFGVSDVGLSSLICFSKVAGRPSTLSLWMGLESHFFRVLTGLRAPPDGD